MLTRRRGLGERGNKILRWRHSNWDWGRLSSRFRLRAYRTVQTRVVSSRSVYTTGFSQTSIFIPTPFSGRTNGASRREQVSAVFFVAWTQCRLTECFPWATEGPNPPKETLTFKKEFFWKTTSGSLPAGLKPPLVRTSQKSVAGDRWFSLGTVDSFFCSIFITCISLERSFCYLNWDCFVFENAFRNERVLAVWIWVSQRCRDRSDIR